MSTYNEADHPRDATGRYSSATTGETDVNLDGYDNQPTPSVDSVMQAGEAELDAYVHHQDIGVRMAAAANPNLTDDQVRQLSDPKTQPAVVRLAVANSPVAQAPQAVQSDPSPTVRAFAASHWNGSQTVEYDRPARRVRASLGLATTPA